VEVILEEKSSSQPAKQPSNPEQQPNKIIQTEEDRKAALYKSSEESDGEEVIGFVGLQEA